MSNTVLQDLGATFKAAKEQQAASGVAPTSKQAQNDAFFDTIWSDEMYMKEIEKYKDKSWYNRLMENPYLRSKQARFQTDPLTALFNYEGAASNYYSGMRSDAMDWLTRFVAEREQEEYNDPASQTARLRAAGQNPDLTGGVSAGEAAENDNIFERSFQNGGSATGAEIASSALSFIGNILSFGQSIQGFNIGAANIAAQELSLNDSVFDSVVKQVAGLVPLANYDNPSEIDSDALSGDIKAAVAGGKIKLSGISRKGRKFFKRWLDKLSNGDSMAVEAVTSELRKRILANNKQSAEIMSSPDYDSDFNKWLGNIGERITKIIADVEHMQAVLAQKQTGLDLEVVSDRNYQSNYKSNRKEEESLRGDELAAKRAYFTWKKTLDSEWTGLQATVKGDGKHWYNTIGIIGLGMLRNQIESAVFHGTSSHGLIPIYGPDGKRSGTTFGRTGQTFGF